MTDPTAVLGKRAGAYVLDGIVGLLLIPLVLLIGSYDFWETFDVASLTAAEAECNAFNDVDGAGTVTDAPPPRGYANDRAVCVPVEDRVVYVDLGAMFGALIKFSALSLVVGLINPVVIQGLTGASIGKHLVGLRVVGEDGQIASFGKHIVRYLLLVLIDANLIGIILVFVTRGHRRLGDMAAKTYVVDRSSVGTPVYLGPPPGSYPPPGYGPPGYPPPGYGPPGYAPPGYGPPGPPPPGYPPSSPPPGAEATPSMASMLPPVEPAAGSGDEPVWSPERDTYILYDREAEAWLQWNGHDRQWGPIDR